MDVEQGINIATHVIAIASIAAAVFPTPVASPVLIFARQLLDYFAFNFGRAKNQAQVEAEKYRR